VSNRKPPNAGKGRKRGSKNKLGADVKAMIEGALSAVGGQKYLEQQAKKNPVAFMTLVGKLVPKDVNVDTTTRYENMTEEQIQARIAALAAELGLVAPQDKHDAGDVGVSSATH
jgi:hypothetical protein